MRIVTSDIQDPYRHLAAESCLLDKAERLGPLLFLWRGESSVVIGRHQNPWRECAVSALAGEGTLLARRISGGGTVFHDRGNLNYAYIAPREAYREDRVRRLVFRALAGLGLRATRHGKNGIGIEDRKISGSAFCIRRHGVLHHGTLLVRADLARMTRVLARGGLSIETHAVPSVPARVVNLADLSSGLEVDTVARCLEDAFVAEHRTGAQRATVEELVRDPVERLRRDMASWPWRFGKTPRFILTLDLPAPERSCRLTIRDGRVTEAVGAPPALGDCLLGAPLTASALRAAAARHEEADWAAAVKALAGALAD